MKEKLGSPFYVAPEVLGEKYTKACDYWSIGVITFILLAGFPPFNGSNENIVYSKIQTCDYDFDPKIWNKTSSLARDFIENLLKPNEKLRLTPI
jgi:calcium-dependent protein kinase